jgi:uncharacterized membrane protein
MNVSLDDTATVVITAVMAVIFIVAFVTPRLTRPELFFGVTVQPWLRTTGEGRAVLRHYRIWLAANTAVAVALAWALRPLGTDVAALLAFAWLILGNFSAYFAARRWVKPHGVAPSTLREADLAPRPAALPGGWPLHAGPFVLLIAAALYLQSHWSSLPERFPIHWGFDGRPNGWATRSLAGVYGLLFIAVLTVGTIALLAALTQRRSRPVQVAGAPAQAERRYRRTVGWLLVAVEYQITFAFLWGALFPLFQSPPYRLTQAPFVGALLIGSVVVVLLLAAILTSMGQGGTRLAHLPAPGTAPIGDRTPDACWKGGIFYVNPDDPALFIEKRFGIGYTLNFAHPTAWLLMAFLLLVLPALAAWLVLAAR